MPGGLLHVAIPLAAHRAFHYGLDPAEAVMRISREWFAVPKEGVARIAVRELLGRRLKAQVEAAATAEAAASRPAMKRRRRR